MWTTRLRGLYFLRVPQRISEPQTFLPRFLEELLPIYHRLCSSMISSRVMSFASGDFIPRFQICDGVSTDRDPRLANNTSRHITP